MDKTKTVVEQKLVNFSFTHFFVVAYSHCWEVDLKMKSWQLRRKYNLNILQSQLRFIKLPSCDFVR